MKKVCICGYFGGNKEFYDGQTVKTKNIYFALAEHFGEDNINKLDTYNWKRNPIGFFFKCIHSLKESENMIILPAHNGVKVFVPLFVFLNKFYHKKIFYVVIGGWLPELLKPRKRLTKKIKRLDRVFVETTKMKDELKQLNIDNVDILVNFKNIQPLTKEEIKTDFKKPYKLCTFSRVMEEKGIEDAIEVVKQINEEKNEIAYALDIYGQVDSNYIERFEELKNNCPDFIKYKGCVNPEETVNVLKDYLILLFPTKFQTEGIPGTIIDGFAAGVPIVAPEWDNVYDLLENKKNGYIYKFNEIEQMKTILQNIDIKDIVNMKYECLETSKKYTSNNAIEVLVKEIENVE